jgi:hypothetical protein
MIHIMKTTSHAAETTTTLLPRITASMGSWASSASQKISATTLRMPVMLDRAIQDMEVTRTLAKLQRLIGWLQTQFTREA